MKLVTFLIFYFTVIINSVYSQDGRFHELQLEFASVHRNLGIPSLRMGYVDNLNNIPALKDIKEQYKFFKKMKQDLAKINPRTLTDSMQIAYDLMEYELSLNLERIALEQKYVKHKVDTVNNKGAYHQYMGKEFYAYWIKRWVDASLEPDAVIKLGEQLIKEITTDIKSIQKQLKLGNKDFYQHLELEEHKFKQQEEIPIAFEITRKAIDKALPKLFKSYAVDSVFIAAGTNEALKNTPGFYSRRNRTFYYNEGQEMQYIRNTGWLFLHEAVPGHHYQGQVAANFRQTIVQQMFWYPGYQEGWAAYVEELGKELGAYPTVYHELGKLEWNIIRAVRLVLDVQLNYYGWTDEQAIEFWRKHIPNKDHIGYREIARMRRWPAQVITYKYGSQQILEWKESLKKQLKDQFDIKEFHHQILKCGPLPFSILKKQIVK